MRCGSVILGVAALGLGGCGADHNTVASLAVAASGGWFGSGGASPGGSQPTGGQPSQGGAPITGGTGTGGAVPCPAEAPPSGMSCSASGQRCVYQDCAALGVTVASCQSTWSLTTTPCGSVVLCASYSGSTTCSTGQICKVYAGGALLADCVENTCGTGPIDCTCLGICSGVCSTLTNTTGVTVYCNTCTQGICA